MSIRTGLNDTTITATTSFDVITCGACGISFGVPEHWRNARRNDHATFYCPNGHPRAFLGESKAERLEKLLETANARVTHAEDQRLAAERSAAAARGQVTKIKKRVGNGVCPCCKRTFQNLHRHMAGQHPDFADSPT